LKQYEKFATFLRNELCSNNLNDFGLKKGLDNLDAVRQTFKVITSRFAEIAIGSGIHNSELQAQSARCRLQVCDLGLDIREGRVRENAEHGSIGYQLAEQLQSFWPQLGV
jgi:hypothetical protein